MGTIGANELQTIYAFERYGLILYSYQKKRRECDSY